MADLTPEEVYAACDLVRLATGKRRDQVSGHSVWKKLGRGSKTTVEQHIRKWRLMNLDKPTPEPTMTGTLKLVEDSFVTLLTAKLTAQQDGFDRQEAALKSKIESLEAAVSHWSVQVIRLQAELDEREKKIERLEDGSRDLSDAVGENIGIITGFQRAIELLGLSPEEKERLRQVSKDAVDALASTLTAYRTTTTASIN